MAKLSSNIIIGVLVLTTLTVICAEAAIDCPTVVKSLLPCKDYVLQGGSSVPKPCCDGATSLNKVAKTTSDRQKACKCMETAAKAYGVKTAKYAAKIPSACGVKIGYAVSFDLDCNTVR